MSQFIAFNFTECNLNQDYSPSDPIINMFCVCCLERDVKFVTLKTCKHRRFLDYFFGNELDQSDHLVCYQCHKFLNDIESFKDQVQESVSLLQKCQPKKVSKRLHALNYTKIEITSAIDSQPLEIEVKIERDCDSIFNEVSDDLKPEVDSFSDGEIDVPLAEIKKEIKKKEKKSRKKKVTWDKLYEGKIRVISLTKEELLQEREQDKQKEGYLKLPYKCEHCIVGFDHELTLHEHTENRHTEKKGSFRCDICQSVLNSEASYREHCKRHYRRYECEACGKRNNTLHAVIKHYNERHGDNIEIQFSCQDCGFVAKSDRAYRYHRDKHKQKQQCSECGNTFVNKTGLRVHMLTVHKHSSRVYSCTACNKTYAAKSGLLAHTASAHGSGGAYCTQCRAHFRTAANLRHHLRTHSNHIKEQDKRFVCNTCEARFLTKGALREHVDWLHLKKTKHECDKCGKVFKNGAALKKHSTFVHEKKRPPRNKICDHCGRGFTTLSILRSHIRTHTGERPLRCARCPAAFAHSAALYTHTKLLHPTEPRSH